MFIEVKVVSGHHYDPKTETHVTQYKEFLLNLNQVEQILPIPDSTKCIIIYGKERLKADMDYEYIKKLVVK